MKKYILILSVLFGFSSLVYASNATHFNRWSVGGAVSFLYPVYGANVVTTNHTYDLVTHCGDYTCAYSPDMSHTNGFVGLNLHTVYHITPHWAVGLNALYTPKLFHVTSNKTLNNEIEDNPYWDNSKGEKEVTVNSSFLGLQVIGQYYFWNRYYITGGIGYGRIFLHKTTGAFKCTETNNNNSPCDSRQANWDASNLGNNPLDQYGKSMNVAMLSLGLGGRIYQYKAINFSVFLKETLLYSVSELHGEEDSFHYVYLDPIMDTIPYKTRPIIYTTNVGLNINFNF